MLENRFDIRGIPVKKATKKKPVQIGQRMCVCAAYIQYNASLMCVLWAALCMYMKREEEKNEIISCSLSKDKKAHG